MLFKTCCSLSPILLQVGVGTCNVGGKGMTDFEIRKKYSKS